MSNFCLWGWRKGDSSYEFVTGQYAYYHGCPVIGVHALDRDIVIVARTAP